MKSTRSIQEAVYRAKALSLQILILGLSTFSVYAGGTMTRMLNWPATGDQQISGAGLAVDPARPSDYYAFYETPGGNSGTNHVLKSTDFGQTWNRIDQTTFNGNAWGVAIDPNPNRNPNTPPTMYAPAGYGDMGLFKSTDGGVHWKQVFDFGSGLSVVASTGVVPAPGGGTTTIPADGNGGHIDFYQVTVLPDNPPNHILVSYHYGQILMESKDGGLTWEVHSIPWGTSHYILAVTATTWLIVAQENVGIRRTTTAGRNNSNQINVSAWSQTQQDGAASGFAHMHGFFTPYVDPATGEIYFAGGGGLIGSSDSGANWHLLLDGNAATVAGTADSLYVSFCYSSAMWVLPKGSNKPTIDHNYYRQMPVPAEWTGIVAPYASAGSFDGTHWIINQVTYSGGSVNGDIWRFVENGTPTSVLSNPSQKAVSGRRISLSHEGPGVLRLTSATGSSMACRLDGTTVKRISKLKH
jgi:hypothetical protein